MASTAYCLYCFDVLVARLERRPPPSLERVERLWERYAAVAPADGEEDDDPPPAAPARLRNRDVARLQAASPASGSPSSSSSSSSPSAPSSSSSSSSCSTTAPNKDCEDPSASPLPSSATRKAAVENEEEFPLFVTWNTISSRGHQTLRGCIGTFEAQRLSRALGTYALAAAFDDHRFGPIASSELPTLSIVVTLLLNFTPCADALDWDVGTHGIRISFTDRRRRYSATYLPDVALEQRWTKEETVVNLMRKAGWSASSRDWRKVADFRTIRYEGRRASMAYRTWREWREWAVARGEI